MPQEGRNAEDVGTRRGILDGDQEIRKRMKANCNPD